MKKIFLSLVMMCLAFSGVAQTYSPIVELVKKNGNNAVFTSVASSDNKKEVEEKAIKSLFHALFFQGVPGINNGKPLVCKKTPAYTNDFFNHNAAYISYLVETDDIAKPKKKYGDVYEGTYSVTLRISALVRDVTTNTGCKDGSVKPVVGPRPTVMVIPYKRQGESYKAILENDRDYRAAVSVVQRGFEKQGIKTKDFMGHLEALSRGNMYEENAGAAESNDKTMLLSAGTDVYVTVDLKKDKSYSSNRVSLILKAYETATGTVWGSQESWINGYKSADFSLLCAAAVNEVIPSFLQQIEKNYSEPIRASLRISLSGSAYSSLSDMETTDGDVIQDFLQDWLDENAYNGDYHLQGAVDEFIFFDYVMIPRTTDKGRKMDAGKFSRMLKKVLKEQGIQADSRLEGNKIILTLGEGM